MMWPIFWPDDTDFSNPANTRHPSADFNADGKSIGDQVAAVVPASGTSDDPKGYGETAARELFPEVMPYVVGTPATYGFTIRNGRMLADDAPEVMLSLVAGTAVPSGLRPSVSSDLRDRNFPYVVPARPCESRTRDAIAPSGLRRPPGAMHMSGGRDPQARRSRWLIRHAGGSALAPVHARGQMMPVNTSTAPSPRREATP